MSDIIRNLFSGWGKRPTTTAPAPAIIKARADYSLVDAEHAKAVQARLTELGYLDPPADGRWGGTSAWALNAMLGRTVNLDAGGPLPTDVQRALADAKPLPLLPSADLFLDRVVRGMQAKDCFISRHPGCRNIVTPEGHNLDGTRNDDSRNKFNDCKLVWHCDATGRPVLDGKFECTSTPSNYWTDHPMNSGGAFNIADGWQKAWSPGDYHGRALRQVGVLKGYRDLNRKHIRDYSHPWQGDDSGVHHHQGYNIGRDDLKNSSAGCQVIRFTKEQERFMDLVLVEARYQSNHGYLFAATVLLQKDVPQ